MPMLTINGTKFGCGAAFCGTCTVHMDCVAIGRDMRNINSTRSGLATLWGGELLPFSRLLTCLNRSRDKRDSPGPHSAGFFFGWCGPLTGNTLLRLITPARGPRW